MSEQKELSDWAWDIIDPAAYADNRAETALKWMRQNAPLGVIEYDGFAPFRVITRNADIREVGRTNDVFLSGVRPQSLIDIAGEEIIRAHTGEANLVESIVNMDQPKHKPHRLLTQNWFMPANVRKVEEQVRTIARSMVDSMIKQGNECDFHKVVAGPYPLHVIMSMFGVPQEDEPEIMRIATEALGAEDPEVSGVSEEEVTAYKRDRIEEFNTYFDQLGAQRRANPRDDLASVIANGVIRGEPISKRAEIGYYITVATAGHDTTSITTATMIERLARDPDLFRTIKQNRELISGLIDEAIRWATPIKHFMRYANSEYELAGETIREGEWLMLNYLSGNRDETVFDNPDVFDITRTPNPHLGFGYGAHVCLGMHLAKLEMKALLEELLARLEHIELAGEPRATKSSFIGGLRQVPIAFTAS